MRTTIFSRIYTDESMQDFEEDINDTINALDKDAYMFVKGSFEITVTHISEEEEYTMKTTNEPVAWVNTLGEFAHVSWGPQRPDYPIQYDIPLYTRKQL